MSDDDQTPSGIIVRLAETPEEIKAAQRLRYRVFYDEFGARPNDEMVRTQLDIDYFDDFTDHLIVIDPAAEKENLGVVGTYRLLTADSAKKAGRFYTSSEYNIDPLLKSGARMLEMGRSCVMADYRTMPVMQLLWTGIARYVADRQIDLLFGCASLHGTDPTAHARALSLLYHNHLAPEELRPKALSDRFVNMNILPREGLDARRIFVQLPPLIKGYLRIGATVGDGAVIDEQFNTIDVCVVLPTYLVTDRYIKHYERELNQTIHRTPLLHETNRSTSGSE